MNILIAQFAHIIPSTKIFDKYLRNAFKGQKKIDLVVLGDFVANKFFKEYRTKSTLKREFEANKKYFLGLAKKYKTTIVAPVIEWEKGKVYKSILVSGANLACGAGNSPLDLHSADFANLGHCADSSLVLRPKFAKNHESQTENPSVIDSALGAESSENISSLRADSQNLRGKPPIEKTRKLQGGLPREQSSLAMTKNNGFAESTLDSAPSTQKDAEFANLHIYRANKLMSFPHWNEASFFDNTQKAQEPLIFSVCGFRIGVIFGWEAHFDEIMIALRKKGVDILCVPCANTFGSNARWQRLMQTRAFLNSCVIVRVNRTGEFMENDNIWDFYGESFIALPDGSLGDMMGEKEGILISEIEKENLEKIKNLWQFR